MRYQRLLVNCFAVALGSCIAFSIYSTLHSEVAITRSNVLQLQQENYHPDLTKYDVNKPSSNIKKMLEKVRENRIESKTQVSDRHPFVIFGNDSELMFRRNQNFTQSTCPTSLQMKLSRTDWTKHLYHPEVMQFTHPGILNISEYDRLLPYWMPYGYKYHQDLKFEDLKEIMNLFSTRSKIISKEGCVTCAVIGNGGVLNNSKNGEEIDNHDMVFRVNNALRKGFEADVGTRTTHYVLMDRSLMFMSKDEVPRDEGMIYLFLPCRLKDYYYIRDVVTDAHPKQKLTADPKDVRIFHPDFIRYFQKIWMVTKSFRPSTGAVMFFAALHGGCDQIDVYGMGFNAKYSEHYYDKKYSKYQDFRASHDFKREVTILKGLHNDGIINWHTRDIQQFKSRR